MTDDDTPFHDDETGASKQVPDTPQDDYKVGYCRPPKHTRFKPGQSGNPRGRRRRPKTFPEAINTALDKKVRVNEGSVSRKMSMREFIAQRLASQAAKGDLGAIRVLAILGASKSPTTVDAMNEDELHEDDLRVLQRYAPHVLDENVSIEPTPSSENDKKP